MTSVTNQEASGAQHVESPARFRPSDVLRQVMIQDLAVSPDGAWVVYGKRTIEDGKYRKRLWRIRFDGGPPEQLTVADASDGRPRFSPDGRALVFLSDRSGRVQPWVLPFAGGEPRQLADVPGNASGAEWSPDGRRVLVVAGSGEQRYVLGDPEDPIARRITDFTWRLDGVGFRDQVMSVYVMPADGGEPRRVTDPAYNVTEARWSSDGARIAFLADRRPEAALGELTQAWTVPSEPGEDAPAPEPLARLGGAITALTWSPTGALAVLGVDHAEAPSWANANLYLVEAGGTRQLGTELDRPAANATFGDLIDPESSVSMAWLDGTMLVSLVGDQGKTLPYRFDTADAEGRAELLAEDEVVCTAVATGGGRVAVVASDRGRPGEVYAVEEGALRPLTTDGSAWLEPCRRDPVRHQIAHGDGTEFDAWLVAAADDRRPGPLVIQIHGGPHGAHGPTPWLEMLALADAGFHVLYPNPRGSAGYGEAFTRAIHGDWGNLDAADVLRLADWAVAEGLADPARIGVLGLSYGGYMVNWLLGHAPGRSAAGVSENPVTDLVAWSGEADLTGWTGERFIGVGTLPDNLDAFLRHSPWVEIARNEAPLLMLQSERDLRCPPGQTELVFAILRTRGRTVEMVRYPDEAHYLVGVGRPDRRVDRMERIVAWFERYL